MDIGLIVLSTIGVDRKLPRGIRLLIRDCSDVRVAFCTEWRAVIGELERERGPSIES